ncbi:MAG: sigma-70 family RNA polymerase sigma factor [Polyangiaceae bacterium]
MTRDARAKVIPIRPRASSVDALSDEGLVAACAAGDANALAQLFDRLCDDVTRVLARLAYVDAQDIPDLVNDVFLAVFRAAPSYRKTSAVKTWVLAIASNIARDRCRKATRGRTAMVELAVGAEEHDRRSLERAVITKELVEKLNAAIPKLPHDLRVAFVMCDVEELPGVEVARVLGIPKGTLYRRLHEARQMLRGFVEGGSR